jgi:hypothetical protein
MLKLLIKLAVVALLANAVYRVGSEYVTFLKFREAVRDAALFRAKTDEELRQRIMKLAEEYGVSVSDDHVSIRREQRVVYVNGSYDKPIEVVPRYSYPWHFAWAIEALQEEVSLLPGAR